jgi:hypothetical protein
VLFPAGQAAHELASADPAGDESPAAQSEHALVPPDRVYLPAGQLTHSVEPAALAYLPTAQYSQNARPDWPLVERPAGQLWQAASPSSEYEPAAQLAHAPPPPPPPLTSPVPAAHPQAVDPDGDTRPLGQSVHVVEPAELEYLPAGHGA